MAGGGWQGDNINSGRWGMKERKQYYGILQILK